MQGIVIEKRPIKQIEKPRLCDACENISAAIESIWDDMNAEQRRSWARAQVAGYLISGECTRYTIKRGKIFVKRFVRAGLESIVEQFNINI